jgi:predicted enzyme related to lactoylglutathione lyase
MSTSSGPTSTSTTPTPVRPTVAFIVDDLRATFDEWTAAGVRWVGRPIEHTTGPNTGGLVVYMIDPDGFRVELIQRRPRG